jgi:hypothetical protein
VAGYIVFMLAPMFHAEFAMIDDWEIASIVGRNNHFRASDLGPLVREYALETNGRFRPGYYTVRILECLFFGARPRLWHASRLLLALVSALSLYRIVRILLPPLAGGVVTLLFFSRSPNEIWIRLGPAEAYGVPLVLMGLAWVAARLGRGDWHPARLFPGFALLLLAGFMKETFVPILPGVLVLIYVAAPAICSWSIAGRLRWNVVDVLSLGILLTGVAAQGWLTVSMLHRYGHQYADEVSVTSLLHAIRPTLVRYAKDTLWVVPVTTGLIGILPRTAREWCQPGRRGNVIHMVGLLTAGAVLILGPQWVVYGNVPMQGRYLTPGNLYPVFAAALGLYSLCQKGAGRSHALLKGGTIGMLVAVALFNALRTYDEANAEALASHKFQGRLMQVVNLKTQHPAWPLLYCSANVFDREPLVSVARFLAVKLPHAERPSLNVFDWERDAGSPRERKLARLLRTQAVDGDGDFARIADFRGVDGRCIGLVFTGNAENCRCVSTVRVRDP